MIKQETCLWSDNNGNRHDFSVSSLSMASISEQAKSYMFLACLPEQSLNRKKLHTEVAQYLLGYIDEKIKEEPYSYFENVCDEFANISSNLKLQSLSGLEPYVLCLSVNKDMVFSQMQEGSFHNVIFAAVKYWDFFHAQQSIKAELPLVKVIYPSLLKKEISSMLRTKQQEGVRQSPQA